jgi:caa(3)-type oxidase subunit IV
MSFETHAHDQPHVIPLYMYLGVGAALLVLTVVTVAAAQIDLGAWNIVVALVIATIKATLVAFIFMHLFYDSKLYFLVFTVALAFLAILIGFSMADTERRGDLYLEVEKPIRQEAIIYTETSDTTTGSQPAPAGSHGDSTATGTHSEPPTH